MVFDSLFGKKCLRCGTTRTHEAFDGVPTCDACMMKIKADREDPRPCPQCRQDMDKVVVHNVIVDRCPNGHGAWLDQGELEVLREAIEAGGGHLATGMCLGMALG